MESPYEPIKFKSPHPSPSQLSAIHPFLSFLEDFRAGSLTTLHKHVLPSGRALNLRPVPSGFIQASLAGLIARLGTVGPDQKVAEPIYDVEVWVDDLIGIAWTPYDFFMTERGETRMTHVGTDVAFLANVEGEWKISGVADNCRVVKEKGRIPHRYEGPETQDPEEEKVVLGIFESVIERMCSHEYERIEGLLLPGTMFTFHRGKDVVFLSVEEFVANCHKAFDGKVVREELSDTKVRIDDDLAMICSSSKFTVGEDVSLGSEMVTLAKLGGKWLITAFGNNLGVVV